MRLCKILSPFCDQNHQTQYISLLNFSNAFSSGFYNTHWAPHVPGMAGPGGCGPCCPSPLEVSSLSYAPGIREQSIQGLVSSLGGSRRLPGGGEV